MTGASDEVIWPEGHEFGEVMSLSQRVFYRFLWLLNQLLGRTYFRMRVRGLEHVPSTGAFVLASVHRSNLDSPVVSAVTRRRLRYMGKESLWKSRFGAWFFTTAGGFPVERGTADRGALRACIEVIERGEPLVMFPEGTRQSGPDLAQLFDGPAYVACKTQVPIVPVGLGGMEAAMGKGAKFPSPARIRVVVGPPILPPPPSADSGRVPRRVVRELTDEMGTVVQALFDEAQEWSGTSNESSRRAAADS